jgi:hypothetical protein
MPEVKFSRTSSAARTWSPRSSAANIASCSSTDREAFGRQHVDALVAEHRPAHGVDHLEQPRVAAVRREPAVELVVGGHGGSGVAGGFEQALVGRPQLRAEWRHNKIELAAHELLQLLDATSA